MSSRGRCRVLRRGTAVGVPGGGMASCGAGRAPAVMEPRFSGGVGKRGLGWCDANRIESTPPQCVSATAFQSSPGPKAGRSAMNLVSAWSTTTCFNPRPARRPGAPPGIIASFGASTPEFQSSPGPKAGRSEACPRGVEAVVDVSILARPEGRALPLPRDVLGLRVQVSILARPEGRALHGRRGRATGTRVRVSILARPEGRALPSVANSCRGARRASRFNPRPARRPGAPVALDAGAVAYRRVSILARPEGRALPPDDRAYLVRAERVSILARPEGRALPPLP